MERYRRLFAALEAIFGKGYVSKLMGKQSNVITLPDKQARKFLDTELNIMEASEGAVKKGVQDLNNLVSDTKRLSTLNDQELLTITNNAERLAVKVNPPAPPPTPTADVLSITTKVDKNKDPNVLIDEYNKNQTRLRLTDDEGGTAISYDEFRKLQSRNNEIEKTLESLNVKPALDEVKPEGIVVPFTKKPKESGIKSLKQEERSIDDYVDDAGGVNPDDYRGLDDFFDNPEDFAKGGRVGMAGGGILKFLSKLIKNKDVNKTSIDLTEKELKYLNELITDTGGGKFKAEILEEVPSLTIKNNKLIVDQGDLDSFSKYLDDLYLYELAPSGRGANLMPPRLRGSALFDDSVVGKLFRQSKAKGGVSQGLDYLTGIERRGYVGGGPIKKIAQKLIKKPKKDLKRQLTDDEINDLIGEVGDLDAYIYDFDGTVGSADKIRKQHKEYMNYMYDQYKTGRLDPKPGEMNTSRMQYLRNKRKEAEMTDDPKLFNPNERDELDNLEEIFSEPGIKKYKKGDPITSENFGETGFAPDTTGLQKAREIEDINQKKILQDFDITGRKKNAKGGLNYLMGL